MKSERQYVLQDASKTLCPKCHNHVKLLCRKDGAIEKVPWFYICFPCQLVTQLGKGEVTNEICH